MKLETLCAAVEVLADSQSIMSVFFNLPDELCREILASWLYCIELATLDTALCSKKWRAQLLGFLPIVEGFSDSYHGYKNLQWMNRRGIAVLELMLDQDTTGIEWQLALSPVWKTVKRLTVCDGTNRSEFISHFNACTNLEFARFEAVDFSQTILNGDIFKNLTHLKLS